MPRVLLLCLLTACASRSPAVDATRPVPPPGLALPRARIVIRTVPKEDGLALYERSLESGGHAYEGRRRIVVTNAAGEVVRDVAPPRNDLGFLLSIDAGARVVVYTHGTMNLFTGALRPLTGDDRFTGCDHEGRRCAIVRRDGASTLSIRIEDVVRGVELMSETIPCDPDGGETVPCRPSLRTGRGVTLVGDRLALDRTVDATEHNVLCVIDVGDRTVFGCRRGADEYGSDIDFVGEDHQHLRIRERSTATLIDARSPRLTTLRAMHSISEDPAGATPSPGARNGHQAAPGIWLHSASGRIVAGAVDVRWSGWADVYATQLGVGASGFRVEPSRALPRLVTRFTPEERRLRTLAATLGGGHQVAVAGPGRRGPVLAFIKDGLLHLADAQGRDTRPPIRLDLPPDHPPTRLAFVTDRHVHFEATPYTFLVNTESGQIETSDDSTGVTIATNASGTRVAFVVSNEVRILDGRSGRLLTSLLDVLTNPSNAYFIEAKQLLVVENGIGERAIYDIHALDQHAGVARPLRYAPIEVLVADAHLDSQSGIFSVCDGDTLRVRQPFVRDDIARLRHGFCSRPVRRQIWRTVHMPPPEDHEVAWLPGYFAALVDDRLTIVRLRDGATLDLEIVASTDAYAVIAYRDGRVAGVYPNGTQLVGVSDSARRDVVHPVPDSADVVVSMVRAFFAPEPAR